MKIIVINSIYHIPISGINYSVKKIGNELIRKGHEYHIITLNMDGSGKEQFEDGIKVVKLSGCKYNTLSGYESFDIIKYLQKNLDNYDIIHIHNYYSFWSLISALICKLKKKPFIFTPYYHGIRGNTKKGLSKFSYDLYKIFGKFLFKRAEKIICISEYEKKLIEELVSIPENKFVIIPPGVDDITHNHNKKIRDDIHLLYVGNLFESKGVQYIIKSIPILIEQYNKKVSLSIIGDGVYKSVLMNLINDLKLNNEITFYYNLTDEELKKKYIESDIFIFLSSSEAYGMVVAEALAMGTPSIVANETALTEFTLEKGCFGVDYPFNPRDIADLIVNVHESNVEVGPFFDKIKTWGQVATDYERIYLDLLEVNK